MAPRQRAIARPHLGPTDLRQKSRHAQYDARERDVRLETEIPFAIDRLREIIGGLVLLDLALLESPIDVRLEAGGPEAEQWSRSTVRRELQFLLSHTVHHFALIALVLERHGVEVADDFGVAPSTLKHWQSHQARTSH